MHISALDTIPFPLFNDATCDADSYDEFERAANSSCHLL